MSERVKPSEIRQDVNGFTRILIMSPPFDLRHPDPNQDYGIHGMEIRLVLLKNNNAVQFLAYTGLHLPNVSDELWGKHGSHNPFGGMGADVGYHAEAPQYEGQAAYDCDLLSSCKCYYDGSSLRAGEWYEEWIRYGNDAIWTKLEQEWRERFSEVEP